MASDVQVLLPLPGSNAAVAYFRIENRSDDEIRITKISSPQFSTSAIHETTLEDGISRMQAVAEVPVGQNSSVNFEPGGLHIMLMNPVAKLNVDALVTLEVHYGQGGMMIIDARARPRNNP